MKELETRIIDIDVASIRKILIDNGAEKIKEENQVNDIYDFEDMSLLAQKGYARIRTVHNLMDNSITYYMTTKKLLSQDTFKVMEENETIILDKKAGEGIFTSLGLIHRQSISKYRESYKLDIGLVEIDINDKNFCPFPYIEIETDSTEHLKRIVSLLHYNMKDTTSKTIYELIDEYNSRQQQE